MKKEDLITGDIILDIGLWRNGDQLKRFEVDRRQYSGKRFMQKMMEQGLSLVDDKATVDAILKYLMAEEQKVKGIFQHSALGFADVQGSMVYLAHTAIGGSCPSVYCEPTVTASKGTLESWIELMRAEVLGKPNLELALAIGVSSPVTHLMRKNRVYSENYVWALIGPSSTGKTTALRLMASVFGSPEEDGGIITDLNTTENALLESFSGQEGWPMLIDEATSQPKWDFSSTVYTLSKGREKNRCNRSGDAHKPRTFSGTVIISGENSLFEQSRQELGMYARMVELTLNRTDDGNHARRLSKGCRENCGTAIIPIAETLLQWQKDKPKGFAKEFHKALKKLRDKIGEVPGIEERHLNMYATTIFSAKLINRVLGLPLNIKKLETLLIDLHNQTFQRKATDAERFYDAIMDEIATHASHFPMQSKSNQIVFSDIWGAQSSHGGKPVVWITKQTFAHFAKKCDFTNYRTLLSKLHEQGLIVKFGDRYAEDHKLGHHSVKCYCLVKKVTA